MAETDVSYEFRGEPGFSCSVFGPDSSHMLHMEVLTKMSAKCSIIGWHKIIKIVNKIV